MCTKNIIKKRDCMVIACVNVPNPRSNTFFQSVLCFGVLPSLPFMIARFSFFGSR